MLKTIATKVVDFLIPLALCVIIGSNFTIIGHMAIPSIAVAVLAVSVLLKHLLTGFKALKTRVFFPFLCWVSIYIVYGISLAIQQEVYHNIKYAMQFKMMLPVYGIVIMLLPELKQQQFFLFFKAFIAMSIALCCVVLYKYYDLIILNNGAEFIHPTWRNFIDMLYTFIIPFKIIHHTFSFFLLFASFLAYYLFKNENTSKISKIFLVVSFTFLAFMLHFISARLSLLLFYLFLFYEIIRLTINKSISYKTSLYIAISAIVLFFTLYQAIPTLRNKINFTILNKVAPNDIVATESSQKNIRLITYKIGWEAVTENMWKGISVGEEDEYFKKLNARYFHEKSLLRARPENQFIYNAATLGLPLSLVLIVLFFFPLFHQFKKNSLLFNALYIITLIYFFTHHPLQEKQFFYFIAFWIPFLKLYSVQKARNFKFKNENLPDGKVV